MAKHYKLECRFFFSPLDKIDCFFLFLYLKLSPLLLVSHNGTAKIKIKKQSLSRKHSAHRKPGSAQCKSGKTGTNCLLQNIHFFRQIYNYFSPSQFCTLGRALRLKYYL